MSDTQTPDYLHLSPDDVPPSLDGSRPFRAVVVIEADITPDWQMAVSQWLVRSGCLYMMAWGRQCSSWDDSVDWADLARHNYGPISDQRQVMTTWHEDGPLAETFRFCQQIARHPTVQLERTIIVHIAERPDEAKMLAAFRAAQD